MPQFLLEDWFAKYKGMCRYNLTSSDVEGVGMSDLIEGADAEVREMWETSQLGYGQSRGNPLLRAEVAHGYDDLHPDQVQVFAGATEAIHAVCGAVLEPGDHAIVVGPIYQLLAGLPEVAGATVTRVDLRYEDGWRLQVDRIREAVTSRTRLIVTNFPNNPTGALPSPSEFDELVAVAATAGATLLCDELYRGLEPEEVRLPAGADAGKHVVSVAGMSKIYGLAGLRVGWVATRNTVLLDRLRTYRYWTSLSGSVPSEILALAGLRQSGRLLDRARAIVTNNQFRLADFIEDQRSVLEWVPPIGGTSSFPRLRIHDALVVATRLAEQHHTFVAPAAVLPSPGQHLRITMGRPDLDRGLDQLAQALSN